MKQLFILNGRLRSGWRVLSFLVVYFILLFAIWIAIGIAAAFFLLASGSLTNQLRTQIASLLTSTPLLLTVEVIQLGLTLVLVFAWRRWLDKKSFSSLGFQTSPGWWQEFLLGAFVIAITWALIFGFSLSTAAVTATGIHLDLGTLLGAFGLGLLLNLMVGWNEETMFRGYILQNLNEALPLILAILISALLFGAAHLLNPGANAASMLGVALFGILAALTYWATGRLWMPIGMHMAWNLFEGPVFGFPVSGLDMGSLVSLHVNGPGWLVGGQFGPESGAVTMVPQVILIVLVYLWGRSRRKGQANAT